MNDLRPQIRAAACLVGLALILTALPAAADQVILDDLIVDGSLCVGFDCVNGESFGFDTIRLKENNLRIHFDDTSTISNYPDNEWRIVINDSANGGAEYFGVEDLSAGRLVFRIFAGARTNALVVDSQGDLGLGTSTPSVDVHVKTGDTPTLRLEQDGTSGFEPQTWDVAGNETNFFIRDVTNGSQLPLRIRPEAPSNSVYVDPDGDVGLGTSSPSRDLHLRRTDAGDTTLFIENTNASAQNTQLRLLNGQGTQWDFRANTNGDFAIVTNALAGTQLLIDNGTGNVTIGASLITGGSGTCAPPNPACDGVFRPDEYTVESIEEHAAYMWEHQHLWGVGPTPAGEPIDLTRKTTGILHELEKAHIYIEQLNDRLKGSEARNAELQGRVAALEAALAEIRRR